MLILSELLALERLGEERRIGITRSSSHALKDTTSSPDLMICADLANGTKHLKLKTPRVAAKHTRKNFRLVVGGDSSVEYIIDRGDGTQSDAVQLARNCLAAWEQLLRKYGLQPTSNNALERSVKCWWAGAAGARTIVVPAAPGLAPPWPAERGR